MKVQALYSFDHGGPVARRKILDVSEGVAKKLMARGLVRLVNTRPPQAGHGEVSPSSVSPAAPASPKTISPVSKRGEPKAPKKATKKTATTRKPWDAPGDE